MSQPKFQPYRSGRGSSGVVAYALADDSMHIQFRSGDVYVYTPTATGRLHMKVMKQLARANAGLSTYISRQVRERYSLRYKRDVAPTEPPPAAAAEDKAA